ncbi:hypothetical protein IZ6_02360 [Terrihabitans soli]|uniref:Uncharacterized protein n=1 Tax=Terrihabitans soli TaxID=708113 RepID=A0A6S6QR35_9HYPH|nr:hypothetical protein [Terrihabitans soli]BCJ89501.1 hypothetical protein IZ6_02360 [Terrihabitans soli]
MTFVVTRAWRNLILALLLGAALVPFAPDTGTVNADTQYSHRIDTAHRVVGGLSH